MTSPAAGETAEVVPASYLLSLLDAKSDAGVGLTASATSGAMGISRTAGTSLVLAGEATSASAKTDKAVFGFELPDHYVPGTDLQILVNCNYSGSGTVTAASTTMAVAAYTEINGVEAALTVGAAQQMASAAGTLSFNVTGTNLTSGQRILVELTMLVTSASGANTGAVNSVGYSLSTWVRE
jgi:hypothetical protein